MHAQSLVKFEELDSASSKRIDLIAWFVCDSLLHLITLKVNKNNCKTKNLSDLDWYLQLDSPFLHCAVSWKHRNSSDILLDCYSRDCLQLPGFLCYLEVILFFIPTLTIIIVFNPILSLFLSSLFYYFSNICFIVPFTYYYFTSDTLLILIDPSC